MQGSGRIFAVFAGHGLNPRALDGARSGPLGRLDGLVCVETAETAGAGADLAVGNGFYEFGAYAAGAAHWQARGLAAGDWVIFANSTILDGPAMPRLVRPLVALTARAGPPVAGIGRDTGLWGPFVTTNLFALRGDLLAAPGFAFVAPDLEALAGLDRAGIAARLTGPQADWIAGRLTPARPWSGWYRAPYRRPLDAATWARKAFAILCEHRLTGGRPFADLRPRARGWVALHRGEILARKARLRAAEWLA